MHLPTKVQVWQVSVCLLRPRPHWLASPQAARITSINSSHSHRIWTLTSSSLLPVPKLCLCHATHLEPISSTKWWLSKTRRNCPSQRMPLLSLTPRDDPSLLYQGPHQKQYGENREHISLSTQGSLFFCTNEVRPFALWFLRKKEEEISGQCSLSEDSRVSEGRERKAWWACYSLSSSPLMNSFISFKIQPKRHLLQNHQAEVSHSPLYPHEFL